MNKLMILVLGLLLTSPVFAKNWQEIQVPGAKCGDGKPYSVLVQKKSSEKLLVEFMGGGVCWDYKSCFDNNAILPWLHPYPVIKRYSVLTANISLVNPFKNHSKIYFPYCTADVHSGDHISHYKDKKVYHYGRRNVDLAIEYLIDQNIIEFNNVNDLVVYGASAGGIGAIVHSKKFGLLVAPHAKKLMIPDSPGLHFGKNFWKKFDQDMLLDFKTSFNDIDLDIDFNEGAVSKKMPGVFAYYHDWRIGFIYSLRDSVMSKKYGEISQEDHKDLMLSEDGVLAKSKDFRNVHVWLRDSSFHTYMLSRITSLLTSNRSEGAYEYVQRLYYGGLDN